MTILVVPHDERNVRRLRLSYRRLRWVAVAGVLLAGGTVAAALTWGRVASRAAQAEVLERENRRLTAESSKVAEIAANLERTEEAYRRIRSMAGLPEEAGSTDGISLETASMALPEDGGPEERPPDLRGRPGPVPSGWPLTLKGFVTAGFTGREDHTGIDIAVPHNTPVVATADGTVKQTGTDEVYGVFIVLGHEGDFETMYAHNANLLVERGEQVTRDQIIAYSGNSGRSSAPHLHYEVRRGGWPVDPTPFLR